MERTDQFLIEEYRSLWSWLELLFKESRTAAFAILTGIWGVLAGLAASGKLWEHLGAGLAPRQVSIGTHWVGGLLLLFYLVGLVALNYFASCRALAVNYIRGINRIRTYFVSVKPEIGEAFLFPHASTDMAPRYFSPFRADHSYSIMISIMNSAIGGLFVWLFFGCSQWDDMCRGPLTSRLFQFAFLLSLIFMQGIYVSQLWIKDRNRS